MRDPQLPVSNLPTLEHQQVLLLQTSRIQESLQVSAHQLHGKIYFMFDCTSFYFLEISLIGREMMGLGVVLGNCWKGLGRVLGRMRLGVVLGMGLTGGLTN